MSHIHYRIRDGKKVYRLWSTICDEYLTDDLTYEEMRTELRIEAIRAALQSVDGPGFENRMKRVHENGSSGGFDDPVPLDGPWKTEHDEQRRMREEDGDD